MPPSSGLRSLRTFDTSWRPVGHETSDHLVCHPSDDLRPAEHPGESLSKISMAMRRCVVTRYTLYGLNEKVYLGVTCIKARTQTSTGVGF